MKITKAFTLVELMVYTTLLVFLALLIGGFARVVFIPLAQSGSHMMSTIKVAIALDVMCRDLRSASMNVARWDVDHAVFCKEYLNAQGAPCSVCVSWEVCALKGDKQGLRRSEGTYNFATHQWSAKTVSVIACPLTSLHMQLIMDKHRMYVEHVCVTYVVRNDPMAHSIVIAPRARVLQ